MSENGAYTLSEPPNGFYPKSPFGGLKMNLLPNSPQILAAQVVAVLLAVGISSLMWQVRKIGLFCVGLGFVSLYSSAFIGRLYRLAKVEFERRMCD